MLQVEICVKGHIAEHWSEWFEGLAITHVDDETVLIGVLGDQAALYGLFAKLRDLGLALVSINLATGLGPTPPGQNDPAIESPPSNDCNK